MAKTVIVLGAGASRDVGFPLGEGLIDNIINNHQSEKHADAVARILHNSKTYIRQNNLMECLPSSVTDILSNSNADLILNQPSDFTSWTGLLHHPASIDQFIYYRKDFSLIAKLNILLALSKFEKTEIFDSVNLAPQNYENFFGVNKTWYRNLFNNIIDSSPDLNGLLRILSEIHFITFNYDRSLEFYLLKSIKAIFPNSNVKEKDLPITHVYGKLGNLDQEERNHLPFRTLNPNSIVNQSIQDAPITFKVDKRPNNRTYNSLGFQQRDLEWLQLANQIQTYGSTFNEATARDIQRMIREAENVYVFGFQFQKQNFQILFDRDFDNGREVSRGYFDATSYELAEEKNNQLHILIATMFPNRNPKAFSEARNKLKLFDFMKNNSIKMPSL